MSDIIEIDPSTGDALEPYQETDFAAQLKEPAGDIYCSFQPTDMKGKKILYRAMNQPDRKINDYMNTKITIVDLFCETIPIKREDGSTQMCPRLVLIDKDGVSYQSVSFGVFNSIRRIIDIFGSPSWSEGITVIPKQLSSGKNKMTVLEIV